MEYKTLEEVTKALKEGKKIINKHGGNNYKLSRGEIGCKSSKWLKVKCYWCNPQMNRTFALLEDGTVVDSCIDIIDLMYGSFIEYVEEDTSKPKKMTLQQIEKELGYKIELEI